MSWKDVANKKAGGAEYVSRTLIDSLCNDGHKVVMLTTFSNKEVSNSNHENLKIFHVGNSLTVYFNAYRFYKKNLIGWADIVIDEMNTIPFFCKFYVKEPNFLLIYQLCREIWFYQTNYLVSIIGYILEPLYLKMLNNSAAITESMSTKVDLMNFGFKEDKIFITPISIEKRDVNPELTEKFENPTIISLGSIRPMKRTLDQVIAFERAKKFIPNLTLRIAGNSSASYSKKVFKYIQNSPFKDSIFYHGILTNDEKYYLLSKSHLILVTSVKEGWGLIVTEANSCGTPAIVYSVDGLKDSVQNNITGLICDENTPSCIASNIVSLLRDESTYKYLQENALQDSKKFTKHNSYSLFKSQINKILINLY